MNLVQVRWVLCNRCASCKSWTPTRSRSAETLKLPIPVSDNSHALVITDSCPVELLCQWPSLFALRLAAIAFKTCLLAHCLWWYRAKSTSVTQICLALANDTCKVHSSYILPDISLWRCPEERRVAQNAKLFACEHWQDDGPCQYSRTHTEVVCIV